MKYLKIYFPKSSFIINIYELSKSFFWKKIEKIARSNFCCSFPLLSLAKLLHFFKLFLPSFMQCLAWIFVILIISYSWILSLGCHETLSNLFPHLHELNSVVVTLTPSKYPKTIYATKKLFLTSFCISCSINQSIRKPN